jgi:hypothetical protein
MLVAFLLALRATQANAGNRSWHAAMNMEAASGPVTAGRLAVA